MLYSLPFGITLFASKIEKESERLAAKNKPKAPMSVGGMIQINTYTNPSNEKFEYMYPASAP